MNITCPHCSQTLELTPDVLAALQGQPHFACPVCDGLMTVPAPRRPTPSAPQRTGPRKPASPITTAQRGLNRNLLVLGLAALLTLGGVAVFLASKNGGTTGNTFQNITNEILHNSYFTQLITDAVTTEKDLEAIAEIRPYRNGFVGVSKGTLSWEQAQNLAKRTGAEIIAVDDAVLGSKQELVTWLATTFISHLSSPIWVLDQSEPSVLANSEILTVKTTDGERKVLLHWQPANTSLASATKDAPAFQSITQQILHTSYFSQLIADGVTSEKDLEAIAEIRPFGGGFIGVSKAKMSWTDSQDLAFRTGSELLSLDEETNDSTEPPIPWLSVTFGELLSSGVWVSERFAVGVFNGTSVSPPEPEARKYRIALRWSPSQSEQHQLAISRALTSTLKSSDLTGRWKCIFKSGWSVIYDFFPHGFVSVTYPEGRIFIYPFAIEDNTLSWKIPSAKRRTKFQLEATGKLVGTGGRGEQMLAIKQAPSGANQIETDSPR